MAQNPIVTIEMEDGGKIVAELYPEMAPISVNNFISLVKKGFYDGLIFHRVISGFMIQGGDPQGVGIGGPGYCIKGEFSANGVKNPLSHKRGVLSMARAQAMDSAGSQFFIMHADGEFLDGQYAAFGMVTEGMDVVDRIAATKTGLNDKPKADQRMKKVTVETFGVEYPEPEKNVSDQRFRAKPFPGSQGPIYSPWSPRRGVGEETPLPVLNNGLVAKPQSGGVLVSTGTWVRE